MPVSTTVNTAEARMDDINRNAWRARGTLDQFAHYEGYTDPGERAAVESVADEVRGRPILDLGVGAGRTTPLLRVISRDYVALDYTPEMVTLCQSKYPDVDVRHGDARDLSQFADDSIGLVVFSYNGIDAVNRADRKIILKEVRRVLQPGGVFLFSAHNSVGPGHGEKLALDGWQAANPVRAAIRVARALAHFSHAAVNYVRYSRLNYKGDDYSIMNASAHDFGILIHYTTLAAEKSEIVAAGFAPDISVYDNHTGARIDEGDDTRKTWWFHFVARKAR